MTSLVELVIAASEDGWRRIGLSIVDGEAVTAGVRLRFVPGAGGVVGWGLHGLPDPSAVTIDGLATHSAQPPDGSQEHPLPIVGFDHLVVATSNLERTCAEIEQSTGEALRRIREAGPVRQGFHRLGPVIVEVVEHRDAPADRASFWGFVWVVADLEQVCAALGEDVISPPRAAVQPGRLIATFRREVGLGVPLALMSPR